MNRIRRPDGSHEDTAEDTFTHWQEWFGGALPIGALLRVVPEHVYVTCKVAAGTVCEHGYRFDTDTVPRVGDGLPVIGLDFTFEPDRKQTPASLFARCGRPEGPVQLEACLEDGRVVEVMGRWLSRPYASGPFVNQRILKLDVGDAPGLDIATLNPAGHPWQTRLKPAVPAATPPAPTRKASRGGIDSREATLGNRSGWRLFVVGAKTEEDALAALTVLSRQKVETLRAQIRDLRAEVKVAALPEDLGAMAEEAWRIFRGPLDDDAKWPDLPNSVRKNWRQAVASVARHSRSLARREVAVALNDALGKPVKAPSAKTLETLLVSVAGQREIIHRLRVCLQSIELRSLNLPTGWRESGIWMHGPNGARAFVVERCDTEPHVFRPYVEGDHFATIDEAKSALRRMVRANYGEEPKPAEPTEPLATTVKRLGDDLTAARNTVKALEERWQAACAADKADAAELTLLRKQADGDMRRLESAATRVESANAEIVRLNGRLNDALRDLGEAQASNDRLRRIINGHECEASFSKQLDDARRSLEEVHARYRGALERSDATIKALREDLADANARQPRPWPGLRDSILRRIGL